MADVFISYSRQDSEFVQRLNTAFVGANRVVWVDWQSIPRGEDWWQEIASGIESADSFVCVVTEHWLTSEICHQELLYARQNSKQVLPVIRQQIKGEIEKRVKGTWMDLAWEQTARDNWDYIRHLNWIFFDDDAKFSVEFNALLKALEEDQPHIKAHTRYQNDALEWQRSNRNPSFLLSGDNLASAEAWLVEGADKKPESTDIQRQYIAESRRVEDEVARQDALRERRIHQFRLAALVLGIVGILAVIATAFAATQAANAIAQIDGAHTAVATAVTQVAMAQQTLTQVAPAQTQVQLALQTITPALVTAQAAQEQSTAIALEAQIQAERADVESSARESLRLASLSKSILDSPFGDPQLAALLSIRALKSNYSASADAALTASLERSFNYQTLVGHTKDISGVAFSPDGQFVLTGSWDGTARLWDRETGTEIRVFSGGLDTIESIAFAPDGRSILASGCGGRDRNRFCQRGTAILWETETGQQIQIFSGHEESISVIAFSPDSHRILTMSVLNAVSSRLWDVQTGQELRVMNGSQFATSAIFSLDGRYILIGLGGFVALGGDKAQLLDAETGQLIREYVGHGGDVTAVAFSPDGHYLLTGSQDKIVRLWDVETGQPIRDFVGHVGGITSVSFTPDGRGVLAGGLDTTVRFWDLNTGNSYGMVSGQDHGVNDFAISSDAERLLTSDGQVAKLWKYPNESSRHFFAHLNGVRSVAFSPDGRYLLTGGGDGSSQTFAFNDDRRISEDNVIHLWSFNNQEMTLVKSFSGHGDDVTDLAFSPDGRKFFSGSAGQGSYLWDVETGEQLQEFDKHIWVSGAFSPDGQILLTGGYSDPKLRFWDAETWAIIRDLTIPSQSSADRIQIHWVESVTFSSDGQYFLTGDMAGIVILWNSLSGAKIREFTGLTEAVRDVAFSLDGKYVVAVGGMEARLWDTETGQKRSVLLGHTDVVNSVTFSPDGHFVVTGSKDSSARIWDWDNETEVRILSGHFSSVNSVTVSPDGRYIVSVSSDGSTRLWDTDYRDYIAYACTRVFRDVTSDERQQYSLDDSPTCP